MLAASRRARTAACWPAARAWCRPWRSGSRKPAHLVDINGVAALNRLAVAGRQARHRRLRAARRVPPAGLRRPARQTARRRGAPHRALSDPQPRHVLRLARACRSGVGMVPGAGGARRRGVGQERARRARHRGARFLQGHHDHGARRRRVAGRGAAAAARRRHALAAFTSSTAAPAISPWPRRSASIASRAAKSSSRGSRSAAPRSIRGASPRPSARSPARAPGDAAFRAAAASGHRRHRSDGGHHHQRRIPARSRARGDAPGAGTGGAS